MENKHIGSSFDDFLEEEAIKEEAYAYAIKEVLAYQLKQEMEEKKITQTKMAELLNTSRAQVTRLLDPQNTSVTLNTMIKVASLLGKKLEISLQ